MPLFDTCTLDRDGETREFAGHGHATLGSAGGLTILRGVFEPGWRWSVDVGSLAGTSSCRTRHLGYTVSGRMHVRCDDGAEMEIGPGVVFDLPAGHDAWVVGDEPCVMLDYSPQATGYAARRDPALAPATDAAMALVEQGYAAFNTGDVATLRMVMAGDVVQHVPGAGPLAGTYKGIDSVLGYYAKLAELTEGTFRAHLVETHGDQQGHVTAIHQIAATRGGVTRTSRGSILFTIVADRAVELLELRADLPADDAFLG